VIVLFHITTSDKAAAILRDGFVDGRNENMTETELRGVFLSDRPLDANEGAWGDTPLAVWFHLPLSELGDFELIEEGKPYREWCIPAELIRQFATIEAC
jgi:hypothetical protein